MRRIILLISLSIFFMGCTNHFIQIFETESVDTKTTEQGYVFENDSIKITYSFWASKGIMAFSVYNKLDKPFYIDWKNSSFIYNGNKLDYWIDVQRTDLESHYAGYYYKGSLIKAGIAINEGVLNSVATTVKLERITFVPPKSYYYYSQFYLMPFDFFKFDKSKMTKKVVVRNDNSKSNTTVYEQDFDISNTPLNFRNFICLSFAEASKDYYFIDNQFYLTSVKEMDYSHYKGKKEGRDEFYNVVYEKSPYKNMTSFYHKIELENAFGYWGGAYSKDKK